MHSTKRRTAHLGRRACQARFLSKTLAAPSAVALLFLVAALQPAIRADPPEEIRVGALGSRGVTFHATLPLVFEDILSAAGDVNGDGLSDFIVVLEDESADFERVVHLVYGAPDLPERVTPATLDSLSTRFPIGALRVQPGDLLQGVAPAGDSDGDGFDDFFILRPEGALEGWVGDVAPGVVYLVHGGSELPPEVPLSDPGDGARMTRFTSSRSPRTYFCMDVASGGDLNGDGRNDLVFAAGAASTEGPEDLERGRVYVLFGGAPREGDVDVEDIGSTLPGFILTGVPGEELGRSATFAGDVDGDGIDDLLVGAPNGAGRLGEVFLVYGGAGFPETLDPDELIDRRMATRFVGPGIVSDTGKTIAAAGDQNGDGHADFLIGAPGASAQSGIVYLVYGRSDLPDEVELANLFDLELGVAFEGRGQTTFPFNPNRWSRAGDSLAVFDSTGDGRLDLLIGAQRFMDRGVSDAGRAYIVTGKQFAPGRYPLASIERGDLPGTIIATETSEWLGAAAAAPGDVNGDGREDFLLMSPCRYSRGCRGPTDPAIAGEAAVYLIYGHGGGPGSLSVEKVEPDHVPLAGGIEATVFGAGFDQSTTVRLGDVPARVVRVETSARLVVEVPPASAVGAAELRVERGGAIASLAEGIMYVPRIYSDIDVTQFDRTGRGINFEGVDPRFTLCDFDQDGLADLLVVPRTGDVFVVYGHRRPPAEITLPDTAAGEDIPDGVTWIHFEDGQRYKYPFALGDITGDGNSDVGVARSGGVTLLFGGDRLGPEVEATELIASGVGAEIVTDSTFLTFLSGGGDFNGDGFGDFVARLRPLVLGIQTGTVFLVEGRAHWPGEVFLEDQPRWVSLEPKDDFGEAAALLGDVDGDGLADVLAGAPGESAGVDGHGYLIAGTARLFVDEFAQDLVDRGDATRFDPFKEGDHLGRYVSAVGDFNGDGVADLALSAEGGGVEYAGESYIVFGSDGLVGDPEAPSIRMGPMGERGVRVLGDFPYDRAINLAPAGDFNGDGLDDLVVGAGWAVEPKAYVVFGGPARDVRLRTLGADGVRFVGRYRLGQEVGGGGTGDFNGDGFDDVVLGGDAPPGSDDATVVLLFGFGGDAVFRRGDANGDGRVDLSDPVFLLNGLFSGATPPPCDDAADTNDDGRLDLSDAVFALDHLFQAGAAPPSPGPETCGVDPTEDDLVSCKTACQ